MNFTAYTGSERQRRGSKMTTAIQAAEGMLLVGGMAALFTAVGIVLVIVAVFMRARR